MAAHETPDPSRRRALACMADGSAGTLFVIAGGVFTPVDLAQRRRRQHARRRLGRPLFLQISDTHIGFAKDANPDVVGTLDRAIELVNAMPEQPALVIHTGDITHLSKPAEFDLAQQLLGRPARHRDAHRARRARHRRRRRHASTSTVSARRRRTRATTASTTPACTSSP